MSVQRTGSRFVLALVSGAVLSACSPSASTAVPPVETAAPTAMLPVAAQATASPPVAAAPVQPLVTGLPDFTRLVETYGPAVVNVRLVPSRLYAAMTAPPIPAPFEESVTMPVIS